MGNLCQISSIFTLLLLSWSWWFEGHSQVRDKVVRTILTVFVPTLLLLWYKKSKAQLPPGPYGLPIVGYLPFLRSNVQEKFIEMAHKYGPIFCLQLGSKLHVVVNSMDLVKVVTHDLDQTFANRNPKLSALTISYGGLNVVWSNKAYWRKMRRILVSQVMSNTNLNACQTFRTHEVRKMVNEVYTKTGTKVNINEIAFETELNVVTSMLWGNSKSGEKNDCGDMLDGFREVEFKIVQLLGAPNISDFIPWLSWFDLQGIQREMHKQWVHLDKIFDNIIEARITANAKKMEGAVDEDGRKDFLQIMLELKDQTDTLSSLNIDQIKALLMDMVVAATDTVSTMVEWVMAEILNHPRIMREVQDELTEVVGMNNIVEESHMVKLTYLDAVIKETLRLHPATPFLIPRCTDETSVVGGYTIPKGSIVYINVWGIHHDPKNWTNPLEFKPERFIKSGKWDYKGNNMEFLPFGSGRRICPGVPLAEKMLMYILASLLHSFEWSLPKDEEFELSHKFANVTRKSKPLIAIPFQRLPETSLYF
uniref:cytochrome P450 71AU50-like isoform X2 n=1 Tax=Erigeron canadensis TaxID=72917 RepID=UPI001CB90C98|nr:cytochrome P450 71AU50-like isoform X2 [Erigeron canadensis]